jgi:Putative zinc-finger
MTTQLSNETDIEHQEVNSLLAWYVNASLNAADQARVEAHLKACEGCRADLAFEQRVYRGIADEAAVEYMPAASLKKLQGRLDGSQFSAPTETPRKLRTRRYFSWQGALAASVSVAAIALSLTAADRFAQRNSPQGAPNWRTVTTESLPRPPDEVIRAVFAPNVTLVELQALLDESHLRIVAGPSEAGVYSLAATSNTPVNDSLLRLRQHANVRFAETTKVVADSGHSP